MRTWFSKPRSWAVRRSRPDALRIAFVYDAAYPWVKGGAERRYYEIARRLASRGHEVHWYCMQSWDGPSTVVHGGIVYHGICRSRPMYTASGRRSIAQALLFGIACLRILPTRCEIFDCCGFPFFSLFTVRLVAKLRGKTMMVTCHEVWGDEYWSEYLGRAGVVGAFVERTALRLTRRVVSVSEDTRDRFVSEIGGRNVIEVIPNGVDSVGIGEVEPLAPANDVIYVGRLCDFKNVDLLLRAVDVLRRSGTTVRGEIVGDGPDRARLEKLAAELGVSEQIAFHGFLEEHEAVYSRIKASKVFVLPSKREGFGIALLEANAAGVPVIVADFPANSARYLIGGGNGAVVDPSPDALAAAILRYIDAAPGAFREDCVATARNYDWDAVALRWEKAAAWAL